MKKFEKDKPTAIVIHHSAGRGTVEDVDRIHRERGFTMIGYHYYIRRNGEVFAGRAPNLIGAHCKGHNSYTLGICFEGDFTKEEPTEAQLIAGLEVVKMLRAAEHSLISHIYNHRDLKQTLCPATNKIKDYILDNLKG